MVTYLWTYNDYYIYLDGTVSSKPLTGSALSRVEALADSLSLNETGYKSQYNNTVIPALTSVPVNMPASAVLPYWSYFSTDSLCIPGICGIEADIIIDETNTPRVEVETKLEAGGRALTFHFYNIKGNAGALPTNLVIRYADSNNPSSMSEVYTSPEGHDFIGLAYTNGVPDLSDFQWYRWKGEPGDSGDAVAKFKSMVFKRSETQPTAPQGGSYAFPVPAGWSDGVPAGDGLIWFSTNTFASDNSLNNQWSTPRVLADTIWMDFEYHDALAGGGVPNPPQKTGPNDERDYGDGWSNNASVNTVWMAMRSVENGVYVGSWDIVRIKGEDGVSSVDVIEFYAAGTKDNYPADLPIDENETENWKRALADVSFDGQKNVIWNYEATKMADGSFRFSGPAIVGINGQDGKGIVEIVNYYAVNNNLEQWPEGYEDVDPTVSGNWSTDAAEKKVDADNPYLWNFEILKWSDGSVSKTQPVIICMMGLPGANAVLGDLDNENDQVAVDSNNRTIESYNYNTKPRLYCGTSGVSISSMSTLGADGEEHDMITGDVVVVKAAENEGDGVISISYNTIDQRIYINIGEGVKLTGSYSIKITLGGELMEEAFNYTVIYKIYPVKGGENAELYNLLPSFSEIKVTNEGKYIPENISCAVYRKIGTAAPTEVTFTKDDTRYKLKYDIDGKVSGTLSTNEELASSAISNYIKFILEIEGTEYGVDETVFVLRDGTKGLNGISINVQNNGSPIKIEALPTDPKDGDAYYVEVYNTATSAFEIHLYIWYSSRGEHGEWVDCGNFKGEPGVNQYIHIKYANLSTVGQGYWFYASNLGGAVLALTEVDATYPHEGEKPGAFIGICVSNDFNDPMPSKGAVDTTYAWQKWEGKDGYGYEYVYTLTSSDSARPNVPVYTSDFMNSPEYQKDDFVPDGWFEGPQSVTTTNKACWMIYRIKADQKWGPFKGELVEGVEKAVLYTRYASDGTSVNVRWYAKGYVSTYAELSAVSNPSNGDIYFVSSNGLFYAYDSSSVSWKVATEYYLDIKNGDGIVVPIDGEGILYVYNSASEPVWVYCGKFGGKDGEDGQNAYVHIKFANVDNSAMPDPEGRVDYLGVYLKFTDISGEFTEKGEAPGDFFGTYNDTIKDDSTKIKDYHWVKAKGYDGIGYEYIFKMCSVTDPVPLVPTATTNSKGDNAYNDDFVPDNWLDSPQSITKDLPRRYKCYRVKKNGIWSAFMGEGGATGSTVSAILDAQYGMDGTSIQLKGTALQTFSALSGFTGTTAAEGTVYCLYPTDEAGMYGEFYKYTSGSWVKMTGAEDGDAYTAPFKDSEGREGLNIFLWSASAGKFIYGGPFGGTNGKDGDNGTSYYVHIKYANAVSTGTSEQYISYLGTYLAWTEPIAGVFDKYGEAPGRYMGVVANSEDSDPDAYSAYTWTLSQGSDGIGYEYVYKNINATENIPTVPYHTAAQIASDEYQKDDYLPGAWKDNPESISESLPRRFMCYRVKKNNKWGAFIGEKGQSPTASTHNVLSILDAQYGMDGTSVELKGTASKVYSSYSEFSATTAETGIIYCVYTGGTSAQFYKRASTGWTKIVGTKDGEAYTAPLTDESGKRLHIFLWSSSSSSFIYGGPFGGANGESQYIHIKYANPAEDGTLIDYLGAKIKFTEPNEYFSKTGEAPGRYMGVYVSNSDTDSDVITQYTWKLAEGVDGVGYEYIFQVTKESLAPSVPTGTSQDDDYVPSDWSDDPGSISDTKPYRWKCYRVKKLGVWSAFMGVDGKTGAEGGKAILDAHYGKDGSDSITIDLNNELDSIPLTYEGKTTSAGNVSSKVSIYSGGVRASGYSLTFTATNATGGTEENVTPKQIGTDGDFEVRYAADKVLTEKTLVKVTAHATIGSSIIVSKDITFTILGVRAATPGQNAIVYRIQPTHNIIHLKKDGKKDPTEIGCSVFKYEGDSVTDVTTDVIANKQLYYAIDTNSEVQYTAKTSTSTIVSQIKYTLYGSSAKTATYDIETVPVLVDGEDGSGASPIVFDVTNEMRSIGLSSDGKALSTQTLTSDIYAWSGSTAINLTEITPTATTIAGTNITLSAATAKTASDAVSHGTITINIPSGSVVPEITTVEFSVKSTVEGKDYARTVSVTLAGVKGGADGTPAVFYELIPSTNAVKKNSSGVPDPSRVLVTVMRYSGDTYTDVTSILASNKQISYSIDGGSEIAYSGTTLLTNGITATGATSFIRFFLYDKAFNASGSVLLDKETVVIVSDGEKGETGDSGEPGTSPVVLDISNDNVNIPVDNNGKLTSSFSSTVTITAFSGTTALSVSSVTASSVTGLDVAASRTYSSSLGVYLGTVTITGSTSSQLADYATISVTVQTTGGLRRIVDIGVTAVKGGKDGSTAVIYELVPSTNNLVAKRDGSGNLTGITPSSVIVKVSKTSGSTTTELTSLPSGWEIQYAKSLNATSFTKGYYYTTGATIPTSSVTDGLTIVLKDSSGNIVDKEGLPLLTDGAPGSSGTSPILPFLSNQTFSIPTDSNGYLASRKYLQSNIYLFKGDEEVPVTTATIVGGVSDSKILDTFSLTTKAQSSTVAYITMQTKSGITIDNTITETIAINSGTTTERRIDINFIPAKQGDKGTSGTSYELFLTSTVAKRDASGNTTPDSIQVAYKETSDAGSKINEFYTGKDGGTKIGIRCTARLKGQSTTTTIHNYTGGDFAGSLDMTKYDEVVCRMYFSNGFPTFNATGDTLLDEQTIVVVNDGERGDDGVSSPSQWLSSDVALITVDSNGKAVSNGSITIDTGINVGTAKADINKATYVKLDNNGISVGFTQVNDSTARATLSYTTGSALNSVMAINLSLTGTTGGNTYTTQKTVTIYTQVRADSSNIGYLEQVFGEANVSAKHGAYINEFLAVHSGISANNVVAFINGSSTVASSSTDGTLMIAAGVPSNILNANNSKFRVYENGSVYGETFKLNSANAGIVGETTGKDTEPIFWAGQDNSEWYYWFADPASTSNRSFFTKEIDFSVGSIITCYDERSEGGISRDAIVQKNVDGGAYSYITITILSEWGEASEQSYYCLKYPNFATTTTSQGDPVELLYGGEVQTTHPLQEKKGLTNYFCGYLMSVDNGNGSRETHLFYWEGGDVYDDGIFTKSVSKRYAWLGQTSTSTSYNNVLWTTQETLSAYRYFSFFTSPTGGSLTTLYCGPINTVTIDDIFTKYNATINSKKMARITPAAYRASEYGKTTTWYAWLERYDNEIVYTKINYSALINASALSNGTQIEVYKNAGDYTPIQDRYFYYNAAQSFYPEDFLELKERTDGSLSEFSYSPALNVVLTGGNNAALRVLRNGDVGTKRLSVEDYIETSKVKIGGWKILNTSDDVDKIPVIQIGPVYKWSNINDTGNTIYRIYEMSMNPKNGIFIQSKSYSSLSSSAISTGGYGMEFSQSRVGHRNNDSGFIGEMWGGNLTLGAWESGKGGRLFFSKGDNENSYLSISSNTGNTYAHTTKIYAANSGNANAIETDGDITISGKSGYTTTIRAKSTYGHAYSIETDGPIKVVSTVYSSDDKLKNYVGEIENGLEKALAIPTRYFTWKGDKDKVLQIGTSAQEVEKVVPEIVTKEEDGTLGVDYAKLSIVALAAIKELTAQVEMLKDRVKELEEALSK